MKKPFRRSRLAIRVERAGRTLSRFLSKLVDRLRPPETTLLLITAIVVGSLTGLAAVLFVKLIAVITTFSFASLPGAVPQLGMGWLIITPALGGLIVGPVIAVFAREAKGHGVPEVMQAMALHGGRIRPRVAVAKIFASSVCIGSGGSAGREGPIVQVGSTLGSVLGQLLRLSEDRIRNLVSCGAAAGVAATFNAPIAGVAFAIEVLAGDVGLGILGNVVISAVTASVISQAMLGAHTAFQVPLYALNSPLEFLLYVLLGLAAALVGVAFIKVLYSAEDLFDRWKGVPEWVKPGIGGLLLGLTSLACGTFLLGAGIPEELAAHGFPFFVDGEDRNIPYIFGSGFKAIGAALSGPLPWVLLATLLFMKMLATAFTLGSGNSGGVFAPSLFMGAMLGGAFGVGAHALFPEVATHPGAYALAGMAGVFAASARAPLTAILIAFEMSNDYGMILPLMAVTITATIAATSLHPESIYTKKLTRRGIRLKRGHDVDILDGVLVREIMDPRPIMVPPALPVGELESLLLRSRHHGALVLDGAGELAGIVTLSDIERVRHAREDWKIVPTEEIMIRSLVTSFPDETMGAALQRIAVRDIGRLPVVERRNPKEVVGIIRRSDIVRAYQRGLLLRRDRDDRANQLRISQRGGTEFVELRVERHSAVAGRKVRELELPRGALLTTRRRGQLLQLLGGDDLLEVGDVVFALANPESVAPLPAAFR